MRAGLWAAKKRAGGQRARDSGGFWWFYAKGFSTELGSAAVTLG